MIPTIDQVTIDECMALAATIAPEIPSVCVLNRPSGFDMPSDVLAVYADGPSHVLWDALKADNKFRGPGPAIIFNDVRELSREIALAVCAHELAHALPFEPIADVEPTPATRAANEQVLRDWRANPSNQSVNCPPWFPDHNAPFHRIACHLWWRSAILAGVVLPMEPLGFSQFELCAMHRYLVALGSEPLKMQRSSFAEVVATPPPERFTARWLFDLKLWMKANPDCVKETLEAA